MIMRVWGAVAVVTILAAAASSCSPSSGMAPNQPILAGPAAPVPAGSLVIEATPDRLTTSRSARIKVTVLDAEGKPVPNTPVHFSLGEPGASERMDSAGHPVFTDVNGRAEDVLRTVSSAEATPYFVTLKIRAGERGQSSVHVRIN
jgi:hypothetical protein